MNCPYCDSLPKKNGKDRYGNQRFKCKTCGKTYIEKLDKPLGEMRLPEDKAILCLKLLVEGNSIRSTERIANVHRDTVLRLLEKVGKKCEELHYDMVKGIRINDLQADEVWSFVKMKDKTKKRKNIKNDKIGSAYTFTAIESDSKFIVAWHLGKRTEYDALKFLEKIYTSIEDSRNRFQMSTDAFKGYDHTINEVLGARADYAQIIKLYGKPNPEQVRYSPSECIGIKKRVVSGNPDLDKASTSYVERCNLTMRMSMRRMTRLTNGFSKKWDNLKYATALHFAYYNYCRSHKTLKGATPAMAANVTDTIWEIEDLLEKATHY